MNSHSSSSQVDVIAQMVQCSVGSNPIGIFRALELSHFTAMTFNRLVSGSKLLTNDTVGRDVIYGELVNF